MTLPINKTTPAQIGTDTKWISIAGGTGHTLALKSDGTLWDWGSNTYGQLGDGTNTDKNTPTQVSAQLNVIRAVSNPDGYYSAIIRADRNNICLAGINNSGQLGNGTSTNSNTFNCNNSICAAFSLVTVSTIYSNRNLAGSGNRTDFQFNCALAASLTPSGTNPASGSANGDVFIDGSVQSFRGTSYVQRHYDIEPATNPNTATGTVTLYYTQAEFTAFNAARGALPALPIDATDAANNKANLRITQYHGVPSGGNNPANYPVIWSGVGAAHVLITPASIAWDADNNWWAVTFPVTGFSGFFASTNSNAPLPIRLESFSAKLVSSDAVLLSWQVDYGQQHALYTVERSGDGISFTAIGDVNPGATTGYSLTDARPLAGRSYYRLKVTGVDGGESYSEVRSILINKGVYSSVYPSPAKDYIVVESSEGSVRGVMSDMQGRALMQITSKSGERINISAIASGIYILKLGNGASFRITKE